MINKRCDKKICHKNDNKTRKDENTKCDRKRGNMKKILTIQEILDENTKIETITDKETLKNVLRAIIDVTSYKKITKDDIIEATEEIYREYNIELQQVKI